MASSAARDETHWAFVGEPAVAALRATYTDQVFPAHRHDHFVIGVNAAGAHATRFRGASRTIPPRTLAIIPPDEVHTGHPLDHGPWEYRAIYPSAALLAEVWDDAIGRGTPHFEALLIEDRTLVDAFLFGHASWLGGVQRGEPRTSLLLFLVELLDRHATPRTGRRPVLRADIQRVLELLRDDPSDRASIVELAGVAGLSPYHFTRVFRAQTGMTPHAYRVQLRVERARELLEGGLGISRVAHAAGFADQSHLTRAFKRFLGVTPGCFAAGVGPMGSLV